MQKSYLSRTVFERDPRWIQIYNGRSGAVNTKEAESRIKPAFSCGWNVLRCSSRVYLARKTLTADKSYVWTPERVGGGGNIQNCPKIGPPINLNGPSKMAGPAKFLLTHIIVVFPCPFRFVYERTAASPSLRNLFRTLNSICPFYWQHINSRIIYFPVVDKNRSPRKEKTLLRVFHWTSTTALLSIGIQLVSVKLCERLSSPSSFSSRW